MADFATESANRVTQPAGTIGGNAPPTPPEIQEIKSVDPASKAPATTDAHTDANSTPGLTTASVPDKELGETATTAPSAPDQSTESTAKAAEQLSAQPDRPNESVSNSAPVDAEGSAVEASTVDDHAKQAPPKPVSVEDVQDADGPASKPDLMEGVAKPGTSVASTESSVPQENKVDAEPTVTDGVTKPEPVPAVSEPTPAEPQTGAKRKAEDSVTLNGETGSKDTEAVPPAEKKQKPSTLEKVVDKVSSTVKKAGRPKKENKKDKKEPAPVGRTARVTRSQAKTE